MTTIEKITALATVLYGERWRRQAAAAMGVDPKQVARWVAGEYDPKPGHLDKLIVAAAMRRADIRAALKRIAKSDSPG